MVFVSGLERPIGKNLISKFAEKCAAFLGKPEVQQFTGHAFRRTSATIVADSGASMLALKRHGRWKSDGVATGYVAESKKAKMEISNVISGTKAEEVSGVGKSGPFVLTNCTLSNCVVNFISN